MNERIKKFIKRLICKHVYNLLEVIETPFVDDSEFKSSKRYDSYLNVVKKYECVKCGKTKAKSKIYLYREYFNNKSFEWEDNNFIIDGSY